MSSLETQLAIACPNCRQPMLGQDLEAHTQCMVRVDLCFPCAGIWFDHLESVQLAPAAVLDLLKQINAHRDDPRHDTASRLGCPRCPEPLALSFDLSKAGRFSYFRCPGGDGRFTPFMQFLREKQFIRTLTPAELKQVRLDVRQVLCSQCGAPIDLEHDSQCRYCQSPVSLLDPDAVEKAVKMWSEAANRRRPAATAEAFADTLRRIPFDNAWKASAPAGDRPSPTHFSLQYSSDHRGLDLVAAGIYAIVSLLDIV